MYPITATPTEPTTPIVSENREIESLVSQTANECLNAIYREKFFFENAILIEKNINDKRIVALGILTPLSPTDPFWNDETLTLDKIYFFVHVMMHIGSGGAKEVFEIKKTYRIEIDGEDYVDTQPVNHIDKYAILILKNETKRVANELALLKKLSHRNIIQLISDFQISYISQKVPMTKTVLMQELMMGDLSKLYFDRNFQLSIEQGKNIVSQVLAACAYLQSQNIAHLDIKPQNCLFTQDSLGYITIKIADLESGCDITTNNFNTNYTPSIADPVLVSAFVKKRFTDLMTRESSDELNLAYYNFSQYLPQNERISHVNHWGAGILITETYFKSINCQSFYKPKLWEAHFPWSNYLEKINMWSNLKMYPKFVIEINELSNCFKNMSTAFETYQLKKSKDPEIKKIGRIALGLLQLYPENRISFEKGQKILDSKLKRKISMQSHANKKIRKLENPSTTLVKPTTNILFTDSQPTSPLKPLNINAGETQPFVESPVTP